MEQFEDDYRELTVDEQNARRVIALAISLINARRPLSSTEIYRDLYADLTLETFRRTFLRDRQRLVVAGLVLKQLKGADGEALWEIDGDASFARDNALTREDALLLDFLLIPMAGDPSFPFARDLRLALTKIDRSFAGSHTVHIPVGARLRNANLTKLEDCLSRHHTAHIVYCRADGTETSRTIAPYGLFFINGSTYAVASRIDGDAPESEPHTYNLSRVKSVQINKSSSFEIPPDFDIRDYIKLPFQMGPAAYTAVFRDDKTLQTRHESVYDTDIAAAWALAEGLRPEAPQELVDAWEAQLAHMACWLAHQPEHDTQTAPHPKHPAGRQPARTKVGRGRKGGIETIRELVSLLGSLCHTGDTIELEVISARLGISRDEAQRLMDIVCQASGEETSGLLISCNEEESEYTLQYPGVRGKPIRLIPQETIAVLHALDLAGIADNDPLREHLAQSLSSRGVQTEEVRQALGAGPLGTPVLICARAQAEGRSLSFLYKGPRDTVARQRHVAVHNLEPRGDAWLVHSFDLDLEQERTFRVDRMGTPSLGEKIEMPEPVPEERRQVSVRFADPAIYRCFDWPELSVIHEDDNSIIGNITYYGTSSTWLLRRIIACNTTLYVYDKRIIEAARTYACQLADQYSERDCYAE